MPPAFFVSNTAPLPPKYSPQHLPSTLCFLTLSSFLVVLARYARIAAVRVVSAPHLVRYQLLLPRCLCHSSFHCSIAAYLAKVI